VGHWAVVWERRPTQKEGEGQAGAAWREGAGHGLRPMRERDEVRG